MSHTMRSRLRTHFAHDYDMILVVDDHPITLQVLARMLRLRGHDARTAPSGHAAINFLSIAHPNLIVLDVGMPDIDGLTLLRGLRATSTFRDTPVIIFSGSHEHAQEAVDAGAQAAFVKGDVPWQDFLSHIDRAAAA